MSTAQADWDDQHRKKLEREAGLVVGHDMTAKEQAALDRPHVTEPERMAGHSKLVYDKERRTIVPIDESPEFTMTAEQQIRARALELTILAMPNKLRDQKKITGEEWEATVDKFEAYIRLGK